MFPEFFAWRPELAVRHAPPFETIVGKIELTPSLSSSM
jgi:hypothetical protein